MTLNEFRTQEITWDKASKKLYTNFEASSGDSNGRKLSVQVIDDSTVVDLTGVQLNLAWQTKSGTKYGLDSFEAIDATKGIFEMFYTTEMLSNISTLNSSFVLIDSLGRIESDSFEIAVKRSNINDNAIQSSNSFTALTTALVEVNGWNKRIDVVEQDYENRASILEETYAPRLTEVAAQLAENETELEVVKSTKMDKNTTGIAINQIDKNKGLLDESYLTETLKLQMSGNTPLGAVPADKSITNIKLANGSVNHAILSDSYNNPSTLDGVTGADFNNLMKTGIYLYINNPLNSPVNLASGIIKNEVINQRWLYQEARATTYSSGTPTWSRLLDTNTGLGTWGNISNGFVGTLKGVSFDISTVKTPGYYYVYAEVKLGFPEELTDFLTVLEVKNLVEYNLVFQKLYIPSNTQFVYTRQVTNGVAGAWVSTEQVFNLYRFPYLKDTDDLNTILKNGQWVAISPQNAPYTSTWNLEVKRFYTTKDSLYFWGTQTVSNSNVTDNYEVYIRNFYNYAGGLSFGTWTKLSNSENITGSNDLPLLNKVVVNFGDSIFGNTRGTTSVSNRIAERTGATVYNIGFGGSRIAQHSQYWDAFSIYRIADELMKPDSDITKWQLQDEAISASVSGLVNGMPSYFSSHLETLKTIDFNTVDYITLAGGTNDYTASVLLDNLENKYDTTTFAGSMRYSLEIIMTKFKHLNVLICSPMYRFWRTETGEFIDDSDTRLYGGQGLPDFVEKGSQVAKEYKVSFLDNYFELGINKFNKEEYFPDTDGTHPNTKGNIKLGSKIGATLVSEY